MRPLRILGAFCLAGGIALAFFVYFAGTKLTLDNQSGKQIHNVYFQGFSGYHDIRIRFLAGGEVLLSDGDRQYRATS